MLDEVLEQVKVKKIINNIKNISEKEKKANSINYKLFSNQDKILFIFYDALFKYQVIINEEIYFDDYLEQLDKLLKKINNIDDLTLGVNNLICKFTSIKLGIKDIEKDKEEILRYLYDKYIINGYFFHGFSSIYEESIKRYGFDTGNYLNYYEEFKNINNIFAKYGITNFLEKDFSKKKAYFTDNFIKSCSYSVNSPGYFYNLLYNREYNHLKLKKDILSKASFDDALKNIKKILNFLEFTDNDKNYILNLVKEEWHLLFSSKRNISILVVKRNLFPYRNTIDIESLFKENIGVYEAVDKLLSERNPNITYEDLIEANELEIISLPGLWEEEVNDKKIEKMELANEFGNMYGNISPLILIGAILISLGVIISIIMAIGG